MEPADSYAAEVNRLLAAAVSLFPTEQQPVELQRPAAPTVDLPDGGSGLATAAEQAAQGYRDDDARAAGLSEALYGAVKQASDQAQQAGASALAIRQTAATEAQAVTAEGQDPHNLVLLVSRWMTGCVRCRSTSSTRVRDSRPRRSVSRHMAWKWPQSARADQEWVALGVVVAGGCGLF